MPGNLPMPIKKQCEVLYMPATGHSAVLKLRIKFKKRRQTCLTLTVTANNEIPNLMLFEKIQQIFEV